MSLQYQYNWYAIYCPYTRECLFTKPQAAVDALFTFYNRSKFSKEDFANLICPMYSHESIGALKQLVEWSIVDASDIDQEKYLLSKKISEAS